MNKKIKSSMTTREREGRREREGERGRTYTTGKMLIFVYLGEKVFLSMSLTCACKEAAAVTGVNDPLE